jgi:hypothetical protein
VLEATYQQYLRQASLQAANDRISNGIAGLPIFPHYSFDLDAAVRRRRRPEVRRGAADREGTPLAQVFRARQGRGCLYAAVQSRSAFPASPWQSEKFPASRDRERSNVGAVVRMAISASLMIAA